MNRAKHNFKLNDYGYMTKNYSRARELSKTQKLQVAALIIAQILTFYAIGIATNFFASPVFSMFWIISYQTAYNVLTFMTVSIAIALSIMALTIGLIEKRKSVVIVTRNKPVISSNKAPDETLVRATAPTFNQKITNNPKSNGTEQKTNQPNKRVHKENESIFLFIIEEEYKRNKRKQNAYEELLGRAELPTLTTQNHASVILELEKMHPNYKVNSRTQTPSNT